MYSLSIVFFSVLVITTVAKSHEIEGEDWNKVLLSANMICSCSNKKLDETFVNPICNGTGELDCLGTNKTSYIENLCESIKNIKNKIIQNEARKLNETVVPEPLDNLNDTDKPTTEKNTNETKIIDPHFVKTNVTIDPHFVKTNVTTEPQTGNINDTATNIEAPKSNLTDIVLLSTKLNVVENVTTIKPLQTECKGLNSTNLTDSCYTEMNSKLKENTDNTLLKTKKLNTSVSTEPPNNSNKTDKTNVTTEPPTGLGSTERVTTNDKPKMYSLGTLLAILFCSFGAGILIAVGSKMIFDRYKKRSYGGAQDRS